MMNDEPTERPEETGPRHGSICRCGDHTPAVDGICDICRMTPDAEQLRRVLHADDSAPVCPHCGEPRDLERLNSRVWLCATCAKTFRPATPPSAHSTAL